MNAQLLDRIPVLERYVGENYTTKVLLWRRRGDKFQPEIHEAVRYRYDDRPNAHVLDSGEEIPAVPLENIYTMTDGTPYFEAIEIEDGQYTPRDLLLNSEEEGNEEETEDDESSEEGKKVSLDWDTFEDEFDIEVDKITEESKSRIENIVENRSLGKVERQTEKMYLPFKREIDTANISDAVINKKDTRLNFWLDHFKEAEEKYGAGGWIKEHMNIILVVVTALAIGILFYTSPISTDAFMQLITDLTNALETLNSNLEALQQSGSLGE